MDEYQKLLALHNNSRGRHYGDAHFLDAIGGTELVLNSFTGPDIHCSIVLPPPNEAEYAALREMGVSDPETYLGEKPRFRTFAELETLAISSARSVFPVRRLGEAHVHEYTRGARTIAGTLIFSMLSRDVFAEFYRLHSHDQFVGSGAQPPAHPDQMPPFHILIQGFNEYGAVANSALIDVTLTNFGTTMSVHDLKMEATYTFVAKYFFPFVQDTTTFQTIILGGANGVSKPLSEAMHTKTKQYEANVELWRKIQKRLAGL